MCCGPNTTWTFSSSPTEGVRPRTRTSLQHWLCLERKRGRIQLRGRTSHLRTRADVPVHVLWSWSLVTLSPLTGRVSQFLHSATAKFTTNKTQSSQRLRKTILCWWEQDWTFYPRFSASRRDQTRPVAHLPGAASRCGRVFIRLRERWMEIVKSWSRVPRMGSASFCSFASISQVMFSLSNWESRFFLLPACSPTAH